MEAMYREQAGKMEAMYRDLSGKMEAMYREQEGKMENHGTPGRRAKSTA